MVPTRSCWVALSVALVIGGCTGNHAAVGYLPAAVARSDVKVSRGEWIDLARDGRVVPYKLYMPVGTGPFPVVIHSHGLGGSRETSTYILEAVAASGIAVFAIQHAGSDIGILPAGSLEGATAADLTMAPGAAENRFADLPLVVWELDHMNAEGALSGRLDLSRLGMSGHSFGVLSTLVAVGQTVGRAPSSAFREPRVDAAIVYSPNKPRNMAPGMALAPPTPIS